jgi:hypothetical protein
MGGNSLVLGELPGTNSESDGQHSGHGNGNSTNQEDEDVVEATTTVVLTTGIEDENSATTKIRKRPNGRNCFRQLEVSSAGDLPCHCHVQRATGSGTTEGALGVMSVGWEGAGGHSGHRTRGMGGGRWPSRP